MKRIQALQIAAAIILTADICGNAMAGQYKTLNTGGLVNGEWMTAFSSPKNNPGNRGIEMEVYEWQTAPSTSGCYQCSITSNRTGKPLTIRMIGLSGNVIGSCTAPAVGIEPGPISATRQPLD